MENGAGRGVSAWRSETEADLSEAAQRIESVLGGARGALSPEQVRSVWRAYIGIEKSVAFIKFDIEEDNPGIIVKLKRYSVPDERQALQFSLKYLKKGADDFALGDFKVALKELRESRNYLRALLREKRLERARKARGR